MKLSNWLQKNWLTVIVALAPYVVLLIFWNQLPDRVPGHWNVQGEVDRYDPKISLVFLPLLTVFILGIFWAIPLIDPKGKAKKFENVINRIALVFALFMLAMFGMVIYAALGNQPDVGSYVIFAILGLTFFLGNLFGKFKPNYFIGIRTPWTLESEEIWRKTHRLGGFVWVGGSILMIVLKLFIPAEKFVIPFVVFFALITLIPIIYSFLLFKSQNGQANDI
jgi:uncharacterized membrane protein